MDKYPYSSSVGTHGKVNLVGDIVYIDEAPLADLLREHFAGATVVCEFRSGPEVDAAFGIDMAIRPLVEALEAAGWRTFCSCEGHLTEHMPGWERYPYVIMSGGRIEVPAGWKLENEKHGMMRLRPEKPAETEAELKVLQAQALELAQAIRNSLAR